MIVGNIDREILSECAFLAIIVVSWVYKGSLGADPNAILVSLGLLRVHRGGAIAALRRDGGLGLGYYHRGVGLDLCLQRLHLIA